MLLATAIFAASACTTSSNVYSYEKTKNIEFKQYKTYAWLATADTAFTALVNKKNLERNLAAEVIKVLNQRGMAMDTLSPDCLFTYTLVMNKTYEVGQQPNEVYAPQVYAPVWAGQANVYYYRPDYGPSMYNGKMSVTTFRQGSLVIDMIDRKSHTVVWRSSAQAKKDEHNLPGLKTTLKEIIPEMFKKFPVKK